MSLYRTVLPHACLYQNIETCAHAHCLAHRLNDDEDPTPQAFANHSYPDSVGNKPAYTHHCPDYPCHSGGFHPRPQPHSYTDTYRSTAYSYTHPHFHTDSRHCDTYHYVQSHLQPHFHTDTRHSDAHCYVRSHFDTLPGTRQHTDHSSSHANSDSATRMARAE